MSVFLISFLLAGLVAASPTNPGSIQARAQPVNVPVPSIGQGDLSAIEPWGPADFSVNISPTPRLVLLPQEAVFMTAVDMVSQIADADFNGRLPCHRQLFRLPQYPRMAISLAAAEGQPNLQRRYVLWGMARALNQYSSDNQFRAAVFELVWQGTTVGSILIVGGPTALDDGCPATLESTNVTASPLTVDQLTWDFEYLEDQLTLQTVSMGAIGALVETAQHTSHTFPFWVGSFPGYQAFWVMIADPQPSQLTKSRIIASIKATVSHMVGQQNYHEIRVTINNSGSKIATLGVTDFIGPQFSVGSASDVATS